MFVLRSAFWLIVGFLLVAPHGTDFGAGATALKEQAVEAGIAAGEQLIVSQITAGNRLPDLLVSVAHASLDTAYVAPQVATVLPRPRPAALS
jgi:hypothetical protein